MTSKPIFNLTRSNNAQSNMVGGYSFNGGNYTGNLPTGFNGATNTATNDKEDELYKHKAKKYHYKCQKKVREIMASGKACPPGYEKYLKPFSA